MRGLEKKTAKIESKILLEKGCITKKIFNVGQITIF